jgi:hypothetical protein
MWMALGLPFHSSSSYPHIGGNILSHIVTIKTEVRDQAAVEAACRRLALPEPVQGTAQLYGLSYPRNCYHGGQDQPPSEPPDGVDHACMAFNPSVFSR